MNLFRELLLSAPGRRVLCQRYIGTQLSIFQLADFCEIPRTYIVDFFKSNPQRLFHRASSTRMLVGARISQTIKKFNLKSRPILVCAPII